MKIKLILLIFGHIILSNILFAQKIKPLKIGDKIEQNIILGRTINSKLKSVKLSDFKGKLIILDFWATHCGSCVAELPKMDSLQRKFSNKLVIIPVTSEDRNIINAYFKKKGFILSSIVEDRNLKKIFPQIALGLQVWIDKSGRILSTTGGEEVNSKNITEYFKTGKLSVAIRIDEIGSFDSSKPLFVSGNGGTGDEFVGRSILTKGKLPRLKVTGGLSVSRYPEKNGQSMFKSLICWNSSPIGLFRSILFKDFSAVKLNLFYIEDSKGLVVQANPFDFYKASSILREFMGIDREEEMNYSIDLPAPGVNDVTLLRDYVLSDLNRYLDFTARIERRKIPVWIIIKKEFNDKIFRKDSLERTNIIFDNNIERNYLERIEFTSVNNFIRFLEHSYNMSPPLFNETGLFNEKIDLNLHLKYEQDRANSKSMNLDEWRAAFQRNGLDIKVEDREVEVMVFRKKETPTK